MTSNDNGVFIGSAVGAGVGLIAYSFIGAALITTGHAVPILSTLAGLGAAVQFFTRGQVIESAFISAAVGAIFYPVTILQAYHSSNDFTSPLAWATAFGLVGGAIGQVLANRGKSREP